MNIYCLNNNANHLCVPQVDLHRKLGSVEIDSSLITPKDIVDSIEDMGFGASLPGKQEKNVEINILGMTCNSCVNNIQSNISEMNGIHSIKVKCS